MFSKALNGANVRKVGNLPSSQTFKQSPVVSSLFPQLFKIEKVTEFIPGAGTPVSVQGFTPSSGKDHVFQFMRVRDVERHIKEVDFVSQHEYCEKFHHENECYQPASNVNLHGVMQTNVPEPYDKGRPTHFNMPGSTVRLEQRYISGKLNLSHPSRRYGTNVSPVAGGITRHG